MPAITRGTPLHLFLDGFCKAASEAFSQSLGTPWSVELDTSEAAALPPQTASVYFRCSVSGALQGNISVQFRREDAILLSQKFQAESVDSSAELNQERTESVKELLLQVTGLAATNLNGTFRETKLELILTEAPDWQGVEVALLASDGASDSLRVGIRLSPELLASISSFRTAAPTPDAPFTETAAATYEPNFDLLLGVQLNLTLRFGRRVLPLREILDLTSGSVVELDREVQEPADLLLGDRLIARGEVVIVDGNYGIRVTELVDTRHQMPTV